MITKLKISENSVWKIWFVAIIMIFIIHCLTLTIPSVWYDESEIIDFGRVILEPNTDWALHWIWTANKAVISPCYLGALLQEIALRITDYSLIGPRLFALLGGIFASTVLLGWLLSHKIQYKIALVLSLIFLLDPIVVASYRSARIDCLAIGLCISACWLLRIVNNRINNGKNYKYLIILAGNLTALSVFIWISSLIIYPLILFELITLLKSSNFTNKDNVYNILIPLVLSGLFTAIIAMIPMLNYFDAYITEFMAILKAENQKYAPVIAILQKINKLIASFKITPILFISFACSILFLYTAHKAKGVMLVILMALPLVFAGDVYMFRIIYLFPYIFIMIAIFSETLLSSNNKKFLQKILIGLLILMLTWSLSWSLIFRTTVSLNQQVERNYNLLLNAGIESIGKGSHKVYDPTLSFYYVGRKLGWKMYWHYGVYNQEQRDKLYDTVDYLIIPYDGQKIETNINGFKYQKTIVEKETKVKENEKNRKLFLNNQFTGGGFGYGPYNVYGR